MNDLDQPIGVEVAGWTDVDWPPIEKAFVNWLNADNFDEHGQQKSKLQELIASEQESFNT
jgi:hypothetical protein